MRAKTQKISNDLEGALAQYTKLNEELQATLGTALGAGQKIAHAANDLAGGVQAFADQPRQAKIAELKTVAEEVVGQQRTQNAITTLDEAIERVQNMNRTAGAVSEQLRLMAGQPAHRSGRETGRFVAAATIGAASEMVTTLGRFASRAVPKSFSSRLRRSTSIEEPVLEEEAASPRPQPRIDEEEEVTFYSLPSSPTEGRAASTFPSVSTREDDDRFKSFPPSVSSRVGEEEPDLRNDQSLAGVGVGLPEDLGETSQAPKPSRWRFVNPRNWSNPFKRRK